MHNFLRNLFLCLLVGIAAPAVAQNDLLNEDFEGGQLPADWSRSQQPNSVGWLFGTTGQMGSSFFPISNTNTTRIAASNDDKYDNSSALLNDASVDYLITPSLDFTGRPAVFLSFDSYQTGDYGSDGSVEVSTDSGATWVNVFSVPQSSNWEEVLLDLSIFSNSSNVMIGFRHNDNGLWADGFAIDNVRVYEPAAYDAQVLGLDVDEYYPIGTLNVTGTLKNLGSQSITSMDLSYSVNGGAPVTQTITGLVILPSQTYSFTHPTPLDLTTATKQDLTVWTSNLNGVGDDNVSNDTTNSVFYGISSIPVKNVIIEDFTGAWCQFCPDGTATINNIVNTNPNAIAVSVHDGDAMANSIGSDLESAFSGGFPKAVVDHYEFPQFAGIATSSRSQWTPRVNARSQAVVPVSVAFERVGWDSATRTISAVFNVNFVGEVDKELRINLWTLEDSVVGSGSGYNQVNFYNTQSGHPYFGAGNPIVGFVHDYTLRMAEGGAWGLENSLPPIGLADGQAYTYRRDYQLPANFDEKHIRLVAMVQQWDLFNPRNRQIFNSAEILLPLTPLPPPTGLEEEFAAKVLKVYPNPFSDRLSIEYEIPNTGDVDIAVLDLYGRKLAQLASGRMARGMNTTHWNGRTDLGGELPDGVYLIRIETQGIATFQKVTLSR